MRSAPVFLVSVLAACSLPPEPQPIVTCVVGPANDPVSSQTVIGTVVASGPGSPTVAANEFCTPFWGSFSVPRDTQADGWFTVDTLDAFVTYAVWLWGDFERPRPGSNVSVTVEVEQAEFAPTQGTIEILSSAGSLWMGTAGRVSDLSTAPFPLVEGPRIDRQGGDCYTQSFHDLEVDGQIVPWGEMLRVRDGLVYHGGVTTQIGESRCADAFADEATVAISQ